MTAPAPASVDGVLPPPAPVATAATVAVKPAAAAPRPRVMPVQYVGVKRSPSGQWTAHAIDPDRRAVRLIGEFPDEHAAALAHDRVAVAFHGDKVRLNFMPAFHRIEFKFLHLYRSCSMHTDVCAMVANGTYEAQYGAFLREVFEMEQFGEFLDTMLEFFIDRADQIGEEALVAGGEKLVDRFVEMHINRAVNPAWCDWYRSKVAEQRSELRRRQKLTEQNAQGQQQQQQ